MWLLAAATLGWSGPAHADCDDVCDASICPGDITVSEFMADPDYAPNYYGEWFEVHNTTTANLDLNGLTVRSDGNSGFTVSGSLLIPAGGYLVFGVAPPSGRTDGVTLDLTYEYGYSSGVGDISLERSDDSIILEFDGRTIDEVIWNNAGAWDVVRNQAHHVNVPTVDNGWANNLAENWCQYVGSSGSGWGGSPGVASSQLCTGSSVDNDGDGYTEVQGDCDDSDAAINPGEIDGDSSPYGEANDDADCDGLIDDGACDDDGDGYAEIDGDCNDDRIAVSPAEPEIIDSVDNDCNGCIDDTDDDSDGVSECDTGEIIDCDPDDAVECNSVNFDPFDAAGPVLPNGYEEGDCAVAYDTNDADNLIEPCASEVLYDGIDQSGDGFDSCDRDNDGYDGEECLGNPDSGFWFDRPEDCDDNDPAVYPGGDEGDPETGGVKDGKDNDCNGTVDDPYKDEDADGYDITEGDCFDDATDPRAAEVNPGAVEVCGDQLDNDCNGMVDDGCSSPLNITSVRGGGLCATSPGGGLPTGALLMGLLALLPAATRRRTEGR